MEKNKLPNGWLMQFYSVLFVLWCSRDVLRTPICGVWVVRKPICFFLVSFLMLLIPLAPPSELNCVFGFFFYTKLLIPPHLLNGFHYAFVAWFVCSPDSLIAMHHLSKKNKTQKLPGLGKRKSVHDIARYLPSFTCRIICYFVLL